MKNKLLAVAMSFGLVASSFAATSGTLLIKGNVPEILDISVTALAIATTLPLDVTQVDTKVATINERSNSNTGYKVTIQSANLGKLVRSGGTENFNYSLKYGTTVLNLTSSQTISYASAAAVAQNKDVKISYTGVASDTMVAGDYTDTLTFTIAAN